MKLLYTDLGLSSSVLSMLAGNSFPISQIFPISYYLMLGTFCIIYLRYLQSPFLAETPGGLHSVSQCR